MTIREKVSRGAIDEIGNILGSPYYWYRYYFKELKIRCLGVHSPELVGVTRYYQSLDPRVVVDFAPTHPEKMFVEEKRKFFMEQGILYVPIFRNELLTKEQFAQRVKEERETLARGYREALEDQSLLVDGDIEMFSDAQSLAQINALALAEVKTMKLRGAAKDKHLRVIKERLLKEMREGIKK